MIINKPRKIYLGSSNFAKVIQGDGLFADKSLLIKEIIEENSDSILITRPRRWGKTFNISMLHHFFSESVIGQKTEGLFDNLLIAKEADGYYLREYQGKCPVIFISFKDVKESSFEGTLSKFKILIQRLYADHKYLLQSAILDDQNKEIINNYLAKKIDQSEFEESLINLSNLLYLHHNKKVYILIDEYDTPLNSAYNLDFFDEMVKLLKNMLSNALKDNPYLEKGIMTGVLRISKDSMLSGLNNLEVHTVLNNKYSEFFGFTDSELDYLFAAQGLEKDEQAVKGWYNGYLIGGITIYNPWSIMSALKSAVDSNTHEIELRPYWVNTASTDLLEKLLQNADIETKMQLQDLIEGKVVDVVVSDSVRFDELELQRDKLALWSLLLSTGYLTLKEKASYGESSTYNCKVQIPNKEIRSIYKDIFLDWLNPRSADMFKVKHLLDNLLNGNIDKFAQDIEVYLMKAASIRDYANQPEAFYHGFMLALTASQTEQYYIESNRESGHGYPDLMFIPKDNNKTQAVILELKNVSKKENPEQVAKRALAQIEVNDYSAKIKQFNYIQSIIKVGIAFDGKKAYTNHKTSHITGAKPVNILSKNSLDTKQN